MITVMLKTPSVPAQTATMDEALIVAENWIERIVLNQENWGCYDWAQVADIQEFKRADRVIGYFCRIEGFIIVSLRKEVAPVKAYSADCNLDPDCDEGMADLIKMKMEAILDAIEQPIQLQGGGFSAGYP